MEVTDTPEMDGWILLPESAIKDGFDNVVTKGAGYLIAEWTMEK